MKAHFHAMHIEALRLLHSLTAGIISNCRGQEKLSTVCFAVNDGWDGATKVQNLNLDTENMKLK